MDAMAAEKKVNPLESVMSSMGKTRDLDGSVDRVPDPPTKLWPVLASMEYYCRHANMHLESIFSVRPTGTRHCRGTRLSLS